MASHQAEDEIEANSDVSEYRSGWHFTKNLYTMHPMQDVCESVVVEHKKLRSRNPSGEVRRS